MSIESKVSLTVSHAFEASAEEVFDAWLDPETAAKWLFKTPAGEMVRVDIDARVGGRFTITRRDGEDVDHVGQYLEIDRPRRLVFTFSVPRYSSEETKVTIQIAALGEGCELTLVHENVLPEWAEPSTRGWTGLLADLGRVVERVDT